MPRPLLYQAPQEPIADTKTGLISRAWYMWLMQLIQDFTTSGDVFGPGLSTDNAIARWDGATGTQLQNSVVTIADDGTFSFPDGIRQTFNPNGTNSGANVGAQAGDPSSLIDGDIWYNSATDELRARVNGVSVTLSAGASSIDHVLLADGATPPNAVTDGNGNFIYVAYTP